MLLKKEKSLIGFFLFALLVNDKVYECRKAVSQKNGKVKQRSAYLIRSTFPARKVFALELGE